MNKLMAAKEIERLLKFSLKNNMIEKLDIISCRNALLDLLNIEQPYEGEILEEDLKSPSCILQNLLDYAYEEKIMKENTVTYRDLLDTKIMGILMPRQSEVVKKFYSILNAEGVIKATDYFYNLSKASNYIRTDRVSKNLYWQTKTEYGDLEITINLSKPEKDPKEIAKAKSKPQLKYPKCLLCIENVGYAGGINHPARQNHRIIPMDIANEKWYLQYSPYVYYNEHCILLKKQHIAMTISEKTFERLFDFIDKMPHYFIGSNADLPIVGGSILSHEHFQGGRHVFPMEKAKEEFKFISKEYPTVKASIVKWPMSVVRLKSQDKNKLVKLSGEILNTWRNYSDLEVDILASTNKNGETILHNTITPIARKNKEEEFEIDLVLRNNRTTEKYPYGIFHPHKELHHIKKENIGLIEVMGLAVLPARLNKELKEIEKILTGEKIYKEDLVKEDNMLRKHSEWIKELIDKYGINLNKEEVKIDLQKEVGYKFLKVLLDAGVYKKDEKGKKAFIKFMNILGFKQV